MDGRALFSRTEVWREVSKGETDYNFHIRAMVLNQHMLVGLYHGDIVL